MARMVATIDPTNLASYKGWGIAEILYSFLVDDYSEYEKNPEYRRMQLKVAMLNSAEFMAVRAGGRVAGGYARMPNPYKGDKEL